MKRMKKPQGLLGMVFPHPSLITSTSDGIECHETLSGLKSKSSMFPFHINVVKLCKCSMDEH